MKFGLSLAISASDCISDKLANERAIGDRMPTLSQNILSQLKLHAWNEHRAKLFSRLKEILDDLARLGTIERAILYGSYLSDKPEPSDIDLIVWLENVKEPSHLFWNLSKLEENAKLGIPMIDLTTAKGGLFRAMLNWIDGFKLVIE